MIQIGRDDLLRALKGFKGIAKQDLLSNSRIPQSDFWKAHAEARRETYAKLIELVESEGIKNACVFAFEEYHQQPDSSLGINTDPGMQGHIQALEMFFNVVGITTDCLKKLKAENTDFNQLVNLTPQFQEDYNSQTLVL